MNAHGFGLHMLVIRDNQNRKKKKNRKKKQKKWKKLRQQKLGNKDFLKQYSVKAINMAFALF